MDRKNDVKQRHVQAQSISPAAGSPGSTYTPCTPGLQRCNTLRVIKCTRPRDIVLGTGWSLQPDCQKWHSQKGESILEWVARWSPF